MHCEKGKIIIFIQILFKLFGYTLSLKQEKRRKIAGFVNVCVVTVMTATATYLHVQKKKTFLLQCVIQTKYSLKHCAIAIYPDYNNL